MKKLLLLLISLSIGIGIFIWIGKIVGWQEIKNAFMAFTGWQGLAILGLTILMVLVGTWRWREILKGIGVKTPFRYLWRIYLASFSIRYLAPIIIVGAEIFQGYILKEKHSVPWSKGMASVMIDRILEWTANLVVVFLGVLFFLLTIGLPPMKLGIIFGGVFLLFAAVIIFFYFKSFKGESMAKFFVRNNQSQLLEVEKEIFKFFRPKKLLMWKAFLLSFFRATIMFSRTWLLIIFLGKSIGALPALSILGFTYLAVMIPIPTALGSHEAIQIFAFNSLGLGASTATAFTMIIRGAELIVALTGVIILFRLGTILIKNIIFKKLSSFAKNNTT